MTYQKLFPIEYNNKTFMIFIDENNRKTFLEINESGEYVYPILEDFISLHKMYNTKELFICYAPKFTFKEKVKVLKGSVVSLLTVVIMLNNIPTALAANQKLEVKDDELIISAETLEQTTKYTAPTNVLEEIARILGEQNVTKEMVIEAINNNDNLNDKYKTIATNLLNAITDKYPNFNLIVFYENIKTMKVEEYTIEEFKEKYPEAPGGGANYNAATNQITTIDEVEIEVLYHEMFHATHTIYRQTDNYIITRLEENTGIDEVFTDMGASLVILSKNSYKEQGKIVEYLLTTADYTLEDYNNYGVKAFIEKLSNKYPTVDINYISEALNTMSTTLIYQGKEVAIDSCPDLIDELFEICLQNISLENSYASFNHFAKIFFNATDPELVFNYLEKYNEKLKQLGYKNIISKEDALEKFRIYKEANGVGYNTEETYPVLANEENKKRIDEEGNLIDYPIETYSTTFDFPSLISSTMFEQYDTFGTSQYWTNISMENSLINPHHIKEIPIYLNGNLLTTDYTSNLFIEVGLTKENKTGYILTDKNGKIIYQSEEELKNLSNRVSFSYYLNNYSQFIEKIELTEVLTDWYLKLFQKETSYFKNIEWIDNEMKIEPLYAINVIKEDTIEYQYLKDCLITSNNGLITVSNMNLSFPSNIELSEAISLKDILAYSNVLDSNIVEYTFQEGEIITMIENYLKDLSQERSR